MADQGANQSVVTAANKGSNSLLNDPIFATIHDIFLLGSSLTELKCRIQIVGCSLSLDSITYDKNASTFIATILNVPVPDGSPIAKQTNVIDGLLNNIVLQDISPLKVEYNSYPESSDSAPQTPQASATEQGANSGSSNGSSPTTTQQALATELRDNAWLTSVLRSLFNQITLLHFKQFPTSNTTNTIYDPPPQPQPQSTSSKDTNLYAFLYPTDVPDFANVGIRSIKDDNPTDNTITSFVNNFKLYDVTRRALNCLTLLLDTADESLVPIVIADHQKNLVKKLRCNKLLPLPKNTDQHTDPTPDDIKAAVKVLSNIVLRLIDAWDSFLLESLYAATSVSAITPDDQAKDNEMNLVAYQAGRSLAALSWNVSVALVPLENTHIPEQQQDSDLTKTWQNKAQRVWLNAFNERDVNSVQNQITALSTAMDAAYYRVNPTVQVSGTDETLAPPNLDLPSQALQAVKQSLDYWQRTVSYMCPVVSDLRPGVGKPLLIPISASMPVNPPAATQVNGSSKPTSASPSTTDSGILALFTWPWSSKPTSANPSTTSNSDNTPATDQKNSPSKLLDWVLSKTLRTELIQQMSVWQSLVLYQQGLQSFTMETVTQRILDQFMLQVEQAVSKELAQLSRTRNLLAGIAFAVFLIVLAVAIAYGVASKNLTLNAVFSNPLIIITAIGAVLAPFVSNVTTALGKVGTFLGSAGTTLESALQQGYNRILIEFDVLNHNVAITYPLIEFFLMGEIQFGENPIKDGYDFLVNVFWSDTDREQELERVVRAAFGPIGAFVGAQLGLSSNNAQRA